MIKFKITRLQKTLICVLTILTIGAFYQKHREEKIAKEGSHIFMNTVFENGTQEKKLNYLSYNFSDDVVVSGTRTDKIYIAEYYSYNCKYCKQFNTEIMPKLKEEYIDKGLVYFAYRPVYDRRNLILGATLKCINNQENRKDLNEKFFNIEKKDLNNYEDYLQTVAKDYNIENFKEFKDCIVSKKVLNEIIYNQSKHAEILELHKGVPVFLINGKIYRGYMSYEEIKTILDNIITLQENKDVSESQNSN